MGLYRRCLARSLAVLTVGTSLIAGSPDTLLDESDFLSDAEKTSAAMIPAPLPGVGFAHIAATMYPVIYRPNADSDLQILPAVNLQWWVSPNLSLVGGLGSGLNNRSIVQLMRIGFTYLPESIAIGRWYPEITLIRSRVEGLPDYELKWNEVGCTYCTQWGSVKAAGGVLFTFQVIFPRSGSKAPEVPGKLEANTRMLLLSIGYDPFPWLVLSAQAKMNPDFITAGGQISIAI